MAKLIQHVSAKRWFSKVQGNTYHSCVLHFNDGTEEVATTCCYGFGDEFVSSARVYATRHGYKYATVCTYSAANVGRKSDL